MKKHFMTGLVIILPIVITVMIVLFVINFLTNPFTQMIANIFDYINIFNKPFLFLSGEQTLFLVSKLFTLLALIGLTLFLGFLGRWFLVDYILHLGDYLVHRIPLVNKIYKAAQEVVHSIFSSKENKFSQVILVPFPQANTWNIGLITRDELSKTSDSEYQELLCVFVPGTPNPMMGFNLLFRRDQVIFLDIKVEDALKFVVSCGVVWPGDVRTPDNSQK